MSTPLLHRAGAILAVLLASALAGAAPAPAAFPGTNGRIAFGDYTSGQIYAVNPDGSGLVQLTHLEGNQEADFPNWSPDGKHLLFTKFGAGHIWVMRADGSHERRIAGEQPGVVDFEPSYTPDARHIVYWRFPPGGGGGSAIWQMRVDGTHKRALTPFRAGSGDGHEAVSADGRIAFTRYGNGGLTARLFVMRSDGSHPHPITPRWLEGGGPDWSPSGRRIAFANHWVENRTDLSLFTVKANGSDLTRLTHPDYPHGDFVPAYSPEGDRILFASDRNYPDFCCNDLFAIDPDGGDQQFFDVGLPDEGLVGADWGTAPLLP
jgi:Tol biopolymer transport system component